MTSRTVLFLLRFYKRWISPVLGQRCRFMPTCSEYMYIAVIKYGTAKGCWLGMKRLFRCNPFFKSGYDPVP